ncbi:MAG: hypothetical protein Q4D91_09735 [Lautropia sp.]|nr:hypothetical protein [Lautropia sp.]
MSIQPIRIPMTAAALALLLAACGGSSSSGGSDRAVSSSPTAPGAGSTLNVNVDANSTAIANAGSGADATAGQSGTPGQSSGNSGEASATGSGSGNGAGGPSNSDSSSNASSTPTTPPAAGATPTPPTAGATPPAAGADAGATPPAAAPGATTPPAAPGEVAPVSAQGVRGDVFVAMLEQKPCGHDGLKPANGPDGSKGSEGMINFFAETDLGNYQRDPNFMIVGFIHGFGCNGKIYAPVAAGEHTYSIDNSVFAKAYTPPRPFNLFSMKVPVTLTAEDVTVGANMTTRSVDMSRQPSQELNAALTADSPYKVKLNELVPFGTLKQWSNGAQLEQLMVLQGGSPREVRMCWNADLERVKRLQCMIWGVPEDWKAGGKLNPVNVTLVEDRSVYEGETGKAYWD